MKVNIITSSEECIDFLSFFQLKGNHSLNVVYEFPKEVGQLPEFTENEYGFTSWLRMNSFSFLKQIDYSDRDLSEQLLKTNTYKLQSFLNKNKSLTYGEFQDLFFYKNEDWKFETMTLKEKIAQREKLKINQNCFGLSLNFLYHENEEGVWVEDEDFKASYEQLKIFYSSFVDKYHPSLLFLLPHFDPDACDEIEILEGRYYPDNYSPFDEQDHQDGWAELGREEERRMDEETDGFWRWNID